MENYNKLRRQNKEDLIKKLMDINKDDLYELRDQIFNMLPKTKMAQIIIEKNKSEKKLEKKSDPIKIDKFEEYNEKKLMRQKKIDLINYLKNNQKDIWTDDMQKKKKIELIDIIKNPDNYKVEEEIEELEDEPEETKYLTYIPPEIYKIIWSYKIQFEIQEAKNKIISKIPNKALKYYQKDGEVKERPRSTIKLGNKYLKKYYRMYFDYQKLKEKKNVHEYIYWVIKLDIYKDIGKYAKKKTEGGVNDGIPHVEILVEKIDKTKRKILNLRYDMKYMWNVDFLFQFGRFKRN